MEWINDSSCNVLFADAATAKRAVVGLGKPLPPDDAPDLQGGTRRAVVGGRQPGSRGRTAARHPECPADPPTHQNTAAAAHARAGLDAADPANISFLWHKGQDFSKAGSAIPLIFRIATVRTRRRGGRRGC